MIKQQSSEEDWKEIWDNACKEHPLSEILEMKQKAETLIANSYDDETMIGYSGGKDSLVLRHLAENCIENPRFISCELQNEFPSFVEWLYGTAPKNIVFVKDSSLSLEFLNEHISYLFPYELKERDAFVAAFRKPTYSYMREHGFSKFLTGKRIDDGNFCGKPNELGIRCTYSKTNKILSINPLAEWKHDHLLAYIQYFGIELPKIYYYPNGFRFGTHPWTERRRLNLRYCDTFDEIMKLEPEVIIKASEKLDIAKDYLEGRLNF